MADCNCRICTGQSAKRRLVEVKERPTLARGNECLVCGKRLEADGFFCSVNCRWRHYGIGESNAR